MQIFSKYFECLTEDEERNLLCSFHMAFACVPLLYEDIMYNCIVNFGGLPCQSLLWPGQTKRTAGRSVIFFKAFRTILYN